MKDRTRHRIAKPGLLTMAAIAIGGLVGAGAAQASSFGYVNTASNYN